MRPRPRSAKPATTELLRGLARPLGAGHPGRRGEAQANAESIPRPGAAIRGPRPTKQRPFARDGRRPPQGEPKARRVAAANTSSASALLLSPSSLRSDAASDAVSRAAVATARSRSLNLPTAAGTIDAANRRRELSVRPGGKSLIYDSPSRRKGGSRLPSAIGKILLQKSRKSNNLKTLAKVDLWTSLLLRRSAAPLRRYQF